MVGRLQDKVAIVTGAAKGLGAADARLFAAEGAKVIIADVDADQGEALAEDIGPGAIFMPLDVRDEGAWKDLIEAVMARFGRLDILVNNAGVVEVGTPETITEQDYRFVMGVSIDGTVWGCKHAIPAMTRSGGGSIINMASIASIQGEPYVAAYCAAKGAIESYTRAVAVHCAQHQLGIRCNSVHPAGIDTPMVQSMPGKIADSTIRPTVAADNGPTPNKLGEPNDIAHLIVYLASDESRFVSGQKFVVDNTISITSGLVPGGQVAG